MINKLMKIQNSIFKTKNQNWKVRLINLDHIIDKKMNLKIILMMKQNQIN